MGKAESHDPVPFVEGDRGMTLPKAGLAFEVASMVGARGLRSGQGTERVFQP